MYIFNYLRPATPWVGLQSDGKILFAVCDCVAGLGNSCIHVSALLQQAIHEHQKDKSTTTNATTISAENRIPVTSLPCNWNKPGKGPVTIGKIGDLTTLLPRKKSISGNHILPVTDEDFNQ
ncbi:Uncharacterized protein APZ42_014079 [Daphnia magna]|uniref:SWIM-type domain-containing protein n=1 Tax=Daphnia magna TaxID=35525 RepID=A0A162Q8V4_9CRUS|nr:Uncharacterized protein APZ42_014079 [Daphnia magna]